MLASKRPVVILTPTGFMMRGLTISCLLLLGVARADFGSIDRSGNEPLARLPAHVRPVAGQVTLFADFAAASEQGVPVYLINPTNRAVTLGSQDGDLKVKLERQDPDGQWQRAQPHAYSWCGNSYYSREIAPRHFLRLDGHRVREGTTARVRYRLYQRDLFIASNEGVGLVNDLELERAGNDAMAVHFGDLALLKAVAFGGRELRNTMDHRSAQDLKRTALHELGSGRFSEAQVMEVLLEVSRAAPGQYLQEIHEVQRQLQRRKAAGKLKS